MVKNNILYDHINVGLVCFGGKSKQLQLCWAITFYEKEQAKKIIIVKVIKETLVIWRRKKHKKFKKKLKRAT